MKVKICVIIPARNEEKAIAQVLSEIPAGIISEVIVINNASTDNTESEALRLGATVLQEPILGYGRACLKGIDYLSKMKTPPEIVVFLDADHADFPEEIPALLKPILEQSIDFVIGSRALGKKERKSMTPQQLFGNWLATRLLKIFYNATFTDLGPFRAIRYSKLMQLKMCDKTYGWTVEMQLKAVKSGLSYTEVPVRYRQRIGTSKISGTVKGTIMAGYKILTTIFKYL
jgi:glycosyltransferase involved in cell wall biosynthesis